MAAVLGGRRDGSEAAGGAAAGVALMTALTTTALTKGVLVHGGDGASEVAAALGTCAGHTASGADLTEETVGTVETAFSGRWTSETDGTARKHEAKYSKKSFEPLPGLSGTKGIGSGGVSLETGLVLMVLRQ